jgi:hypothetical protein
MLAAKTHKMQTNTASTVAKDPTKPASKIGPSPPHSLPAPQPDGRPAPARSLPVPQPDGRPAPARSLPVPQPDGRPDPLFASGGGWARTGASRPGGPRGSWDFGRIAINAPTGPANAPSGSARASDHFAPFRVQSQPATKIPPAPAPQKGEQPLGKLKDRLTGAEVPIYRSLVPRGGLWWFNGGSPKLAALYPSSNELPLADLGKGGFALKITAGSDKASLAGGGAALTGNDLDKITIQAIGPSKKHDDVEIEIKHRAPGAKSDTILDLTLEVKAPDHLKLLGTDHSPAGKVGYLSLTSLQVFDNFGEAMPYIDVNEDFGTATFEAGVSSRWKDAFAARTKGSGITHDNAVFRDQYGVALSGAPPASMTPKPSSPNSPLGKTRVGSFPHDWYVGSATTGKGVRVSHHTGTFYTDHAEYTDFTSPPATAKAPAGKKP